MMVFLSHHNRRYLVLDAFYVIVPHPLVTLDQVGNLLVINSVDGGALFHVLTDLDMWRDSSEKG